MIKNRKYDYKDSCGWIITNTHFSKRKPRYRLRSIHKACVLFKDIYERSINIWVYRWMYKKLHENTYIITYNKRE